MTKDSRVGAVHRIWPSAVLALEAIQAHEGGKPTAIISQLLIDYAAGLQFAARQQDAVVVRNVLAEMEAYNA